MKIGWYIVFAVAGGYFSGGKGVVAGIILGFIYYRIDEAFSAITRLQESVAKLREKVKAIDRTIHQPEPTEKIRAENVPSGDEHPEQSDADPLPKTLSKKTGETSSEEEATVQQPRPIPEQVIAAPQADTATIRNTEPGRDSGAGDFFLNLGRQLYRAGTVVQTGIVLLLFGLIFLVRYAARNQQFTVEAGLAATMVVGMILLIVGWRLIRRKRAYALMLQGGSVAVLFTCLFLSTEVYSLFPIFVSFAAMICLSVLAGLLAVQYKARETALIGMGGGFAAPLLSPVTSDQLIFLFSYYLILVIGIFAVSRLRNWRVLQLLSFLFIAFVGVFLGRTEDVVHVRAQLEPFLLLFFLFYSVIEIRSARKRETAWGDGMDLTLTLGPPSACIAFQAALSYPDAMYLFSLTLALSVLYYSAAAYWLRRTAAERLTLLIRICIALAYLCFNTLIIMKGGRFTLPLLTLYYTASAYCLRRFVVNAPLVLVQICISLAFFCGNLLISYKTGMVVSTLIYNAEAVCWVWIAARKKEEFPFWLGFILLPTAFLPLLVAYKDAQLLFHSHPLLLLPVGLSFFLAPFFSALLLVQTEELLRLLDEDFADGLFLWSLFLWLAGGTGAVMKTVPVVWAADITPGLLLLFISLSFAALRLLGQRFSWSLPERLCHGCGFILSLLTIIHLYYTVNASEKLSWIFFCSSTLGWVTALCAHYALLFLDPLRPDPFYRTLNHRIGVWLIGCLIILQLYSALTLALQPSSVWLSSFFGMVTGGWILALLLFGRKLQWPVKKYPLDYQGFGILPFALFAWGCTLNLCLSPGDPAPLIYIPFLNPLECAQGICLAALFLWAEALKRPALQAVPLPPVVKNNMRIALYGTSALCLTMMIARTVCYYTDIVFSADGILFSPFFQTVLSIIWSAVAFFIMLFSRRSNQQRLNALGTMLLFLVAAKLFLVDIHLSREIERICSFMWVGGIMLSAGYFMPADEGEPE